MPRGDGTGPTGMGPMTGRAAGYCAGYATPGFANPATRAPSGTRPYGRRVAPAYSRLAAYAPVARMARGRGPGSGGFGRGGGRGARGRRF